MPLVWSRGFSRRLLAGTFCLTELAEASHLLLIRFGLSRGVHSQKYLVRLAERESAIPGLERQGLSRQAHIFRTLSC